MNSRSHFRTFAIGLVTAWLVLFVFIPNLMVVLVSFLSSDPERFASMPLSLEGYRKLFDPLYLQVTWQSIKFSALATIVCLLLAFPFAYGVVKAPRKLQPLLLFCLIVPFWTNSLIRTYALKVILGRRGLLNNTLLDIGLIDKPIKFINTEMAVVIGLIYILLPFMILPIYASLEKLDTRLLEAARDLGASRWQRTWHVTLPLTAPGMIAGSLLVFVPAMGMFYVSDLLGGAKNALVGNVIKSQFLVVRDWPLGAASSVVLTLLMGLMLLLYWHRSRAVHEKGGLDG